MTTENTKYELIERFLNNQLSRNELSMFNKMLQDDPSFAEEVKSHQLIHNLFIDKGLLDVRNTLDAIHKKHSVSSPGNRKTYLAGAIGIALTGIAIILLIPGKTSNYIQESDIAIEKTHSSQTTKQEKSVRNDAPTTTLQNTIVTDNQQPLLNQQKEQDNKSTDTDPLVHNIIETENDSITTQDNTVPKNLPVTDTKLIDPKKVHCDTVEIIATVTTSNTCNDEASGSITIHVLPASNSMKPYNYSINNVDFRDENVFNQLPAGYYTVYIRDNNNCNTVIELIDIKEIKCHFRVAPLEGEEIEINLTENSDGHFEIYNKIGAMVYSIPVYSGNTIVWTGTDQSGNYLPMGAYNFFIRYKTGEIQKGSVTIIR
jgi:hypothetical protein